MPVASQTQNIANSIFQQFFPTFLNREGFDCFFFFTAVNAFLFVFVFFVVPETRGVPLEEMDVLFGGANHVNSGAELTDTRWDDQQSVTRIDDRKDSYEGNKLTVIDMESMGKR